MNWVKIWIPVVIATSGCGRPAAEHSVSRQGPGSPPADGVVYHYGAIVRGDTAKKNLALVFTGDEFADGGGHILSVLRQQKVPGSFFLTGKFYRNPEFQIHIKSMLSDGHYLGAHSDQHLLYCDWVNRDSLLVNRKEFELDLENNYKGMARFGITKEDAPLFLPPYEWYNDTISTWTQSMDLQLINLTHVTLSHADY
ncbi:MAG: polysaccharide deacetylase family protein, partial [Bacteroidales bacterium]|nr:polysaccharide deacetylase family protein [Bacteroidales bacterium]